MKIVLNAHEIQSKSVEDTEHHYWLFPGAEKCIECPIYIRRLVVDHYREEYFYDMCPPPKKGKISAFRPNMNNSFMNMLINT